MQLIRYNPVGDALGIEKELDKLLSGGWPALSIVAEDSAVDMYTEGNTLVAEVALPNFKKEDIKVTATNDRLEIAAEHTEKEEKNGKRTYLLHETSRSYLRRVGLPAGADTDEVTASFDNGKLVVTMPFTGTKEAKEVAIT